METLDIEQEHLIRKQERPRKFLRAICCETHIKKLNIIHTWLEGNGVVLKKLILLSLNCIVRMVVKISTSLLQSNQERAGAKTKFLLENNIITLYDRLTGALEHREVYSSQ